MNNLEMQINALLKELENLIQNNTYKKEIDLKRKELDDKLKEYLKDIN